MRKFTEVFLKVLAWSLVSLVVVLILAIELFNTSLNKKVVAAVAPEFIEGELSYSKLRLHLLPEISLSIDSLVINNQEDTVAMADKVRARVKTWPLLRGSVRINEIMIDELCANLWKDENGKANWNIVKSSSEEDTLNEASSPLDLVIDHLFIDGCIAYTVPSYSVLVDLDSISLNNVDKERYDAVIDTKIDYCPNGSGKLHIPFRTEGVLGYSTDTSSFTVLLDSMRTNLAYVPMLLDGKVVSLDEGYDLNLDLGVEDYTLKPVLDNYLAGFSPDITKQVKDGTISLKVHIEGLYSDNTWPNFDAALKADLLGAKLRLSGKVANLTDKKPKLEAHGTFKATLDSFMRFIPDSMGVDVSGKLNVAFNKPYSTDGRFNLTADSDSLFVKSGDDITAKLKGMHNTVSVTYVKNHYGKRVPKLEVNTENRQVRLLYGGNRIMLRDLGLTASVQKRKVDTTGFAKRRAKMPRRVTDSIPEYLQEKDFEKSDIAFSMDSSVTRFLTDWSPAGKVHLGRGSVVSPQFPLRVRINGIDGNFDSNKMDIDYTGIQTGRSDFAIAGDLSGYGRMLRGKKGIIRLNLDAYSKKCNVNELMAALNHGDTTTFVENGDVHDESFAIDTLTDAQIEKVPMPLVVIPANLVASINLNADTVNVANLDVTPMEASIRVRERTLQLLSSKLATSIGEIDMDAYYSTKTKKDISAGINMEASRISAAGIIQVLPSVDSLFPILKSFDGNMNARLTATTQLDTNMNVIQPSLNAMFKIYGKDLKIDDAGDLKKVTRLLLFRNPNIGHIQDMSVGGIIRDSKIEIYPFVLGVDRYKLALSGIQGFDGEMNYHASILRSPLLIRFGIDIKGTTDKWKWKLCKARYKSSYAPVYTQRIDTMQFNLAESIRSVYSRGINNIEKAVVNQMTNIASDRRVDDSLQLKMVEDTTSSVDVMPTDAVQTSFDENSRGRINALREKIEQRAVTRRSEIDSRKRKKD